MIDENTKGQQPEADAGHPEHREHSHIGHHKHDHPHEDCFIDIEGREYPWPQRTITEKEICELGQLPADQPVIEIDADCVEHQLAPDAVVTLKPGHCFGKKPRFKRGNDDRLTMEAALLQRRFPKTERSNNWFRIPDYLIEALHWNRTTATICFEAPTGYPGNPPYGFYVEGGLRLANNNGTPQNYQEPAATPFPGVWGKFSWSHDGNWRPSADTVTGNNLLDFALTFADRLREAV